MKETAFSIFNYGEIIGRFLAATAPLDGPSCFPVDINFSADNMTEPPTITCTVYMPQNTGKWDVLFLCYVDQNTPLSAFLDSISQLRQVVDRAFKSAEEQIPYKELLDKEKESKDASDDFPF